MYISTRYIVLYPEDLRNLADQIEGQQRIFGLEGYIKVSFKEEQTKEEAVLGCYPTIKMLCEQPSKDSEEDGAFMIYYGCFDDVEHPYVENTERWRVS